jgi:hypothetical protein
MMYASPLPDSRLLKSVSPPPLLVWEGSTLRRHHSLLFLVILTLEFASSGCSRQFGSQDWGYIHFRFTVTFLYYLGPQESIRGACIGSGWSEWCRPASFLIKVEGGVSFKLVPSFRYSDAGKQGE